MTSSEEPCRVVFRMVRPPRRRLFRVDPAEYEVSDGRGSTRRDTFLQLLEALGVPPESSRRDLHGCEIVASRLHREGCGDEWVDYPMTQVVTDPEGRR